MRNIIFSALSLFVILILAFPVSATTFRGEFKREVKQEVREEVKERVQEKRPNLFDRVKDFVRKNLRFDARITGIVAAKVDSSLTVTGNDEKTYQVNVTDGTKLVRRFGGITALSEFAVGNTVHVFGKFTNDEKTSIDAKLIRNTSVQKRWGAFFGEVTAKNTDNFVIKSVNRGSQTVYFGTAEFVNVSENAISYADIAVGHRVRVKGVWDNSNNTITEVDQVKDFSL
jgi:hypothetical protein